MLERVWRIASSISHQAKLAVATDSQDVAQFAESLGASVIMTSPDCRTGTDRVAEAYAALNFPADAVVSLQGDAVLLPPWVIDEVLTAFAADSAIQITTPAVRLNGQALHDFVTHKRSGSSTGTTVVTDAKGNALYFSKGIIPYCRDENARTDLLRHIGLYCYRPEVLQKFASLEEGRLEKLEKLEQLRALENGIPIRVVEVDYRGRTHASVDNPEDIAIVEKIIDTEGEIIN